MNTNVETVYGDENQITRHVDLEVGPGQDRVPMNISSVRYAMPFLSILPIPTVSKMVTIEIADESYQVDIPDGTIIALISCRGAGTSIVNFSGYTLIPTDGGVTDTGSIIIPEGMTAFYVAGKKSLSVSSDDVAHVSLSFITQMPPV